MDNQKVLLRSIEKQYHLTVVDGMGWCKPINDLMDEYDTRLVGHYQTTVTMLRELVKPLALAFNPIPSALELKVGERSVTTAFSIGKNENAELFPPITVALRTTPIQEGGENEFTIVTQKGEEERYIVNPSPAGDLTVVALEEGSCIDFPSDVMAQATVNHFLQLGDALNRSAQASFGGETEFVIRFGVPMNELWVDVFLVLNTETYQVTREDYHG